MTKPLRKTPIAAPPRPNKAQRRARPEGAAAAPAQAEVLELQRTIGNRAVRAMLDRSGSGSSAPDSDRTDTEITDTHRVESVDMLHAEEIIKRNHPEAFAARFQAHGIDVVRDELVITPRAGAPAIRGRKAAEAVMQSPRLAAVFAHAGRSEEIQKGEVQAASNIEIERALKQPVEFGEGKHHVATTAGALVTSEYGVGLLANTFVHHGGATAQKKVHAAIVAYLAKHAYTAGDEAWRAGAEAAIRAVLETIDHDRATTLRKQLSAEPGSFE